MNSIVSAVSQLESRRKALELELATVNSRLKAIQQALGASTRVEAAGASKAASGTHAPVSQTGRRKGRKLRQWFASGEAVGLMKKIVHSPMTASDIVKQLARAKGYDKGLSAEQRKRFQGTAYMAVSNAVKAGKASKTKDGLVRVR
ncbi:MAG: hypothetical protein JO133_02980 [Burkholderiaceae bacterium]|nr:hypothetical protein [Burkholderiaceae bacterium]